MPTISIVQITNIVLSPNPVNINGSLSISLTAAETTLTLTPEITYAGDCYSGENYTEGG